ncbi:MAG: DUF3052 domain-containing protein [Mycobacteriales bacterium]|nr:MAG: DUF3052 domain-containing protein [Pseudonocardiales bacterium]
MSVNAGGAGGGSTVADRLGITQGMIVQELGFDPEDGDETLRSAIVDRSGSDLVDDATEEVVDVVLLWWRDGDGDLVDTLVDAIGPLADSGVVWLLTPKVGRDGHVEPWDISEAAPTAGLSQTSTLSVGHDWSGARLVAPKAARGRR